MDVDPIQKPKLIIKDPSPIREPSPTKNKEPPQARLATPSTSGEFDYFERHQRWDGKTGKNYQKSLGKILHEQCHPRWSNRFVMHTIIT